MPILVLADHNNQQINSATLSTITAAYQLGRDVHLIVLGSECQAVAAEGASIANITQVLVGDHPDLNDLLAESVADILKSLASSYSHILAPANSFGKNILPRLAALLDVGQLSDVIAIDKEDIFKRPIYAGNAIATVQSTDPIKVITVRPTAFAKAQTGETKAPITPLKLSSISKLSSLINRQQVTSDRPDLSSARIIVSGGRGLQNKENVKLLEELADCLGAGIGASRAAVDAGFVSNDLQVGQTGKVVAPDLYIAIGISGAIQHIAGMKDSKVIVAINKDSEAPIFQLATYGLVGDLFEFVPQLIQELKALKK